MPVAEEAVLGDGLFDMDAFARRNEGLCGIGPAKKGIPRGPTGFDGHGGMGKTTGSIAVRRDVTIPNGERFRRRPSSNPSCRKGVRPVRSLKSAW